MPEGIRQAAVQHRHPDLDQPVGAKAASTHRLVLDQAPAGLMTRLTIDSTTDVERRSPEAVTSSSLARLAQGQRPVYRIARRIETPKMNRLQVARSMLFAVAGLALVSGCSSAGASNGNSVSAPSSRASDDGFVPPFRGETRAQVIAQYDEPDQVFQSENGESWVYFFGKAKQFIPFYGPFAERRILTVHFNEYGRVIGWESQSNRL